MSRKREFIAAGGSPEVVSDSASPPDPATSGGLLDYVEAPAPRASEVGGRRLEGPPAFAGLRSAQLVRADGGIVAVQLRGALEPVRATVAEEVEAALLQQAIKERQQVLVELNPGSDPVIVGLLQTRVAERVQLSGKTIEVEATEQLTLRSGRAALRLKSDGDIEVVGSRINAASRGLFKIVGRVLRLN